MPSLKQGFNCGDCELNSFVMPFSESATRVAISNSAQAVAYHAGYEGTPADDPTLDECAQECARKVLENACKQWVAGNDGFDIRDGRHKAIKNN